MTPLLTGISLGFSAGIGPGPLTTLVISTTLARGFGAGLLVALAPLLTDAPIIGLTLVVISALPAAVVTGLAVAGGLYLLYLGGKTVQTARTAVLATGGAAPQQRRADLGRGALVNMLNPAPWLFWLSVGGPILTEAGQGPKLAALGFLVGFYALLVGCKIGLAWAVASGRRFLTDVWYRRLLAGSGLLLAGFGLLLIWQATLGKA
ncbi:MAG: LysE family transporter [Caldilineaceae bacterium]|nr:LysE family transporter [Caldilineaceae bacterium]